jgi:hypothetical protein
LRNAAKPVAGMPFGQLAAEIDASTTSSVVATNVCFQGGDKAHVSG